MKILALLTPADGKSMVDFQPHMVAEEKMVWGAYCRGMLREMYFQPEPIVVSLVFEAADHDAVHATLATFPMVAAALFEVKLIDLGPWFPLQALFDPAHAGP